MNRNFLLLFAISLLLFSCSSTSPDQYFGRAALSSNLLYGFASDGFHREFASPSEKLVDASSGKTAPMKRAEVLKTKVDAVEEAYANVKRLKIADDNREMLNASLALYEFVLPVYKNEYQALANLYDSGADTAKIAAKERFIVETYAGKFGQLYDALHAAGKKYATEHGIKVMDVNPAPPEPGQ